MKINFCFDVPDALVPDIIANNGTTIRVDNDANTNLLARIMIAQALQNEADRNTKKFRTGYLLRDATGTFIGYQTCEHEIHS